MRDSRLCSPSIHPIAAALATAATPPSDGNPPGTPPPPPPTPPTDPLRIRNTLCECAALSRELIDALVTLPARAPDVDVEHLQALASVVERAMRQAFVEFDARHGDPPHPSLQWSGGSTARRGGERQRTARSRDRPDTVVRRRRTIACRARLP